MFNSMDTNLVIGLINELDRLHEKTLSLIKDKSNWVLPSTVIKETKDTLRKKINIVYSHIIREVKEILRITNYLEMKEELIILFKKLSREKPNLRNFLEKVYRELDDYLTNYGASPDTLLFLSELAENMSRIVEASIRIHIPYKVMEIKLSSSKERRFLGVVEETFEKSNLKFKDTGDKNIFLEIMLNIEKYNPLIFYTDDEEFSKKGKRAYSLLVKNSLLSDNLFTIERIDP